MIDRLVALATSGIVIAGERSYAFEQRRFTCTVFSDDDGDRLVKADFEFIAKKWQSERIGLAIFNSRWIEPDTLQIRSGQIDLSILSGHSSRCPSKPQPWVPLTLAHRSERNKNDFGFGRLQTCGKSGQNPVRLESKFRSNLKLIWAVQTETEKDFALSELNR